MADDKQLAAQVQAATTALNGALRAAHKAGLRVEVDSVEGREFQDRFPCPTVLTTVSRPL